MSDNTHIMDEVLNERVYELLDHYSPYELLTGLYHNVKNNFDGPEYRRVEAILAGTMTDIVTAFADEAEKSTPKGELAEKKTKEAGIDSYDIALPQPWLDEVADWEAKRAGVDRDMPYRILLHGTVWSYPKGLIMGKPFFLTKEAEAIHKRYCLATGA